MAIKVDGKQNYQCKDCKRHLLVTMLLSYLDVIQALLEKYYSWRSEVVVYEISLKLSGISIGKVLRTLTESTYQFSLNKVIMNLSK
jgi:transposase-like protein